MATNTSRSIAKSMLVNTAGILGSRVFGLLRDILTAAYWGSTETLQAAFTTAFAIPNILRSFFAEGAFTAAFVPTISQKLKEGKEDEAWKLACRTISLQATLLAIVCILVAIISPVILLLLPDQAETSTTARIFQILPIIIPYAFFICIAGAFAAILNSLKQFAIPALTPIIFNIVQIATVVLLFVTNQSRHDFSSLVWFCISVLVAGLLQMLCLMTACRRKGFMFHFDTSWKNPEVVTLMKRIAPGLIGSGAQQLNIFIDKGLAVFLGAAAVGAINYSNRLIFLPIGIFGAAMGIACLPSMSRASEDEMADCLDAALRQVLFLALPCTTLMAALNTDIIRLLFQRGAFTEEAVRECAWALAFYLPGLPAFCAAKVATTTHHGRKDTKTPVKISLICILTNFILNICLIFFIKQGGLALASSISSWLNVLLLLAIDTKKLPNWKYRRTAFSAFKLALAAACAGATAYAAKLTAQKIVANLQMTPSFLTLAATVIVACFFGSIAYLIACRILGQHELTELLSSVKKRKK